MAAPVVDAMAAEGELVAPRLARGCRCFAAFELGEVVGYGWLSTGSEWIGELAMEITPGAGEAYIWNCVTLVPHRRRGIFRALLVSVTRRLASQGLRRLWIGSVEPFAERAIVDAGFQPVLSCKVTSAAGSKQIALAHHAAAGPDLIAAARSAFGLGSQDLIERPALRRKH